MGTRVAADGKCASCKRRLTYLEVALNEHWNCGQIDRTIDGVVVTEGLVVWDYDLRPRRVVGVVHHDLWHDGRRIAWYGMTDDQGRAGSEMDAKRMWRHHPTTRLTPEAAGAWTT